jgi:hypothetical protein
MSMAMNSSQSEAVKTAGERLEAIEAWSRRTFIAAAFAAACTGILASATLYVGYEYIQLRRAASQVASSLGGDERPKATASRAAGSVRRPMPARPEPARRTAVAVER